MNSRKIMALTIVWLGFNPNINAQVEQLKKELSQLNKSLHGLQATVHNLSQNGLVPLQEKLLELAHPRSRPVSPNPLPQKSTPPPSPKLSRPSTSQADGVKPQQEFKKITVKDLRDMNISFIRIITSSLHAAILENIINFQLIPYEKAYSAEEKTAILNTINLELFSGITKNFFNQPSFTLALNTLNKKFNGTANYSNEAGITDNTNHEQLLKHKQYLNSHKSTYLEEENSSDLDFDIDKHNGFGFFNLDVLKNECQDLTPLKTIIISIFSSQQKEADIPKKNLILKNAESLKKDILRNYRKTIYSLNLLETLEKTRLQPQTPDATFISNIKSLTTQLETERSEIIKAHEDLLKKLSEVLTKKEQAKNDLEEWNPLIEIIEDTVKAIIESVKDDSSPIDPITQNRIQECTSLFTDSNKLDKCLKLEIKDAKLYAPLKFLDQLIKLAQTQNIKLRISKDSSIKTLVSFIKNLYENLQKKEPLKEESTIKDNADLFKFTIGLPK